MYVLIFYGFFIVFPLSEHHFFLRSATVDAGLFSRYFINCPVVTAQGRTHPVETFFLEDVYQNLNYLVASDSFASLACDASYEQKVHQLYTCDDEWSSLVEYSSSACYCHPNPRVLLQDAKSFSIFDRDGFFPVVWAACSCLLQFNLASTAWFFFFFFKREPIPLSLPPHRSDAAFYFVFRTP